MMKKVLFLFFVFCGFTAFAQTAQSVNIDFNKTKVPGTRIVIAGYEPDFVQNALNYRLEKVGGLRGTYSKGFRLYAAQNFPYFGTSKYDIYTLIERSNKNAPVVTLNLLVSKGYENFVSPNSDPELTQKMLDFLTDFSGNYLKEYERIVRIDQLTTLSNTLEKEITTLTREEEKLRKDIEIMQYRLKEKEKELAGKESDYTKTKAELESLKD